MVVEYYTQKTRRRLSPEDILTRFDDECIGRLAALAKLPERANLLTFKAEVQRAAGIYLREAAQLSGNDRHNEVVALWRAASQRKYPAVKVCLEHISNLTRDELNERGSRFRPPAMLPQPALIEDPTQREEACRTIVDLSTYGGRWREGRNRPSGRRSRTWEPLIYAPQKQSHPRRRAPERTFVMWLQVAYLDSVGTAPALTASAERVGPFARMVRDCLRLVGAPEADAVGLINDVHAMRRDNAS
jgi:hypothetical protein